MNATPTLAEALTQSALAPIFRHIVHQFTPTEAVAYIKRAPTGTRFAAHLNVELPLAHDPGHYTQGLSYLNISRNEAMRLAKGLATAAQVDAGARIEVRECYYRDEPRATYWLG